jgi:diaminobutyrate-2-oxoglutarate transaminase
MSMKERSETAIQGCLTGYSHALKLDPLIERTMHLESSARSYSRTFPIGFAGGEGHYLIGTDGRRYLDLLTGAGVMLLGHNHPSIREAIAAAAQPILSGLDLMTTARAAFMECVVGILPASFQNVAKIHFCSPTGSDSVEAALKLARLATGRSGIFAFTGSYHGMSQGALAVTSNVIIRRAGLRVRDDVQFMPFPYPFRSRTNDVETLTDHCLDHIRSVLDDDHSGIELPGAMLIEAVQGEGGNVVAPRRFLHGLRQICDQYGILLIFDEIQCGLGRTGRWFAFEHAEVSPDMICVSKGIGGGFPLSLLIFDRALDCWSPGDHTGTFRGQEFAFLAGSATIRTINEGGLIAQSSLKGRYLAQALGTFSDKPGYGELRGLGLFLGLECRSIDNRSAGEIAQKMQAAMLRQGIMVERGGRNSSVLRFLPPLTIAGSELDSVAEAVGNAFATLTT